uniref:NADH-ubiquinone oxidoreductase chain 2 n=1 Tax=Eucriotettix oculatus TaxID=470944 RepID=A0A6G6BJ21_9ORTH|nr:NADH dehydrogenase subunit 2 [Eucriotettix oculatus]QPK42092.1 NADH dehydrogenase subunit 2 [Eucriotettix oculatus]
MNKAPMKMLFITMMILSTLISTSSNNWLGAWMGLEINLLSFIPLITYNKNFNSNSSGIKYFIVQSIASIVLLSSVNSLMINDSFNNQFMIMLMAISILMKMGAAPLHFWFPEIMENLEWNNCIMLMTWQKIAPMIILSYTHVNQNLNNLFILMSAFTGAIMGLNQISLRLIMAYSSINHMAWMIMALSSNSIIWTIYFSIYSLITTLMSLSFMLNKIFMINEIYLNMNYNKMNKFNLALSFLSMGGMPPLMGFLPKWLLIENLINKNQYFMTFMLILSSTITLYFYMKMFLSAGLIMSQENKWYLNNFSVKITEKLLFYMNSISILGLTMSTIIMF